MFDLQPYLPQKSTERTAKLICVSSSHAMILLGQAEGSAQALCASKRGSCETCRTEECSMCWSGVLHQACYSAAVAKAGVTCRSSSLLLAVSLDWQLGAACAAQTHDQTWPDAAAAQAGVTCCSSSLVYCCLRWRDLAALSRFFTCSPCTPEFDIVPPCTRYSL